MRSTSADSGISAHATLYSRFWRYQFSLAIIAILVFFTNLGAYALFDEDEPKNAVCGREMYERGDWIVPTFNGELRTDKPILIYWLMQVSFRMFGISEFSARFGSAILAVGTTLLTFHLGRKLYTPEIGWLAGVIVCTSLMFSAVGRSVTPDSTLIFCVTLAFTSYVWAVAACRNGHFSKHRTTCPDNCASHSTFEVVDTANDPLVKQSLNLSGPLPQSLSMTDLLPASWIVAIPMYLAMGMAVLAKGPIGFLLPCAIIGLNLLVTNRRHQLETGTWNSPSGPWWRRGLLIIAQVMDPKSFLKACFQMRLPLGILVVLAVALPWYVTVGFKTDGEWLRGFLGDHNVGRFLEAKEKHSGPIFYYVIALLLGCFPWSVFLPLAIWHLHSSLTRSTKTACRNEFVESDRFVACWGGFWLLFFSFASTKLPNYVLPMYPALALIVGKYLDIWRRAPRIVHAKSFRMCCRALGAIGIVVMIAVPVAASVLLPGEEWLLIIGAVPLLGSALAYTSATKFRRFEAVRILEFTAVALAVLVTGIAPISVGSHQDSPKIVGRIRKNSGTRDVQIAAFNYFSPNLVFYAGKPILRLRSPEDVVQFLNKHPNGFVVTRSDRFHRHAEKLKGSVEFSRQRQFLRNHDTVVIGHPSTIAVRGSTLTR